MPIQRTPEEWRAEVCPEAWQHAAAVQLHGWALHEHHEGAPILLVRDDYEAAIEAASHFDESGQHVPHQPALSPRASVAED